MRTSAKHSAELMHKYSKEQSRQSSP